MIFTYHLPRQINNFRVKPLLSLCVSNTSLVLGKALHEKHEQNYTSVFISSHSLDTDLKYFDTEGSTYKNGLSKEFPDFEAWRRVKNEMDTSNILVNKISIIITAAVVYSNRIIILGQSN